MNQFHKRPNVYVENISIRVMNLERAVNFYTEIIGFNVIKQTGNMALLTVDGKNPLLTLKQPENVTVKERRTTGLYHFALLLPSRGSLSSFLRHLMKQNVPFGTGDHHVSEAIYLNDPDGNGIEVYRDRSPSDWNWSHGEVMMTTEPVDVESLLGENSDDWRSLPNDTVMGHIHLHVENLKDAEKFYTQGLNFNIVNRYQGALFMSTGNYHHHIAVNIWNGEDAPYPQANSVGLDFFTIVLADEAARTEIIGQLRSIGAEVTKQGDIFVTKDPVGHHIHLKI